MQVASLISNNGLMSSLNISIPTDDFVDRLNDFLSIWDSELDDEFEYETQMKATWRSKFKVNLTRVLHPKGFCFTFNFPPPSKVFDLNK